MNFRHSVKLLAASLLIAFGLAACDKPGPAENAGQKIDRMTNEASKKMNETVDKVGDRMSAQSAKAGVAIDDTEITGRIKTAIFTELGLKSLPISVDTVKGVVTLTGAVESQANKDQVRTLAAAVAGVEKVENQLTVK